MPKIHFFSDLREIDLVSFVLSSSPKHAQFKNRLDTAKETMKMY